MFQQKSLDKSGKVPTLSVIISLDYTSIIMKNSKIHKEKPKRRFCAAMDGPRIRELYATMRTADLAREMGLTVKQIVNYAYRQNTEQWTRKKSSLLSQVNSENGKRGGRPQK